MRRLKEQLIFVLAAFSTVGLLAACGDAPKPGKNRPEQGENTPPPEKGELTHVDSEACNRAKDLCSMGQSIGVEVPLKAKIVDGKDQPVKDVVVSYEVTSGSGNVSFAGGSKSALTQSNGVATATIVTAEEAGDASIRAYTSDDSLGEISWNISISPKGGMAYNVNVNYEGEAAIGDAEVKLFPGDKKCSDLISDFSIRRNPNHDPAQLPSPVGSIPPRRHALQMIQENKYEGKYIFNKRIETGKSYTAWAVGYKVDKQNVDEPDVELAYGCASGDKLNSPKPVEVDVDMKSHIPLLKKEYNLYNEFDLVGGLPDNVERFVRLFGLLIKSPGSFLIGCKPGDTGVDGKELCPEDQGGQVKGILDLLVENLPGGDGIASTAKDVLKALTDSGVGRDTIRTLVDELVINKLIESNKYTESIRNISEDIYDSLTRFSTRGTIHFNEQPMPMFKDGKPVVKIPEGGGKQQWEQIKFYWRFRQGCDMAQDPESCRTQWFNLDQIMPEGKQVVKGDFDKGAVLRGSNDLDIGEHELSLNFGALMVGTVENIVLPRYFSAPANGGNAKVKDLDTINPDGTVTLNEVIQGTIADCDSIASSVAGKSNKGGTIHTTIKKACNRLIDSLTQRLKQTLYDALKVDGNTVTIQTAPGEPCTIHQPEIYPSDWETKPLPYIESLGKDKEGKMCTWNMKFSFSDDPIKGDFYTE